MVQISDIATWRAGSDIFQVFFLSSGLRLLVYKLHVVSWYLPCCLLTTYVEQLSCIFIDSVCRLGWKEERPVCHCTYTEFSGCWFKAIWNLQFCAKGFLWSCEVWWADYLLIGKWFHTPHFKGELTAEQNKFFVNGTVIVVERLPANKTQLLRTGKNFKKYPVTYCSLALLTDR